VRATARRIAVIACLSIAGIGGAAAVEPPVDAGVFLARLREAAELAERSAEQPSPARMTEVRAIVGLPASVSSGAWSIDVTTDSVLESLAGTSQRDFDEARSRIEALAADVEAVLAREPPDAERTAAALAAAYRGVSQADPSLLERFYRAVADVIGAVLYRVTSAIGDVGSAFGALLVLALGGGALWILARRLQLLPDRVLPASERTGRASPTDWSTRADEAVRTGDLHEAVRVLYLLLLASLAGRGWLAEAPALTAGEARSAVGRTRPALLAAVTRATERYEQVIYGGTPAAAGDVEALQAAVALVRHR
jgi:hypothetical protein